MEQEQQDTTLVKGGEQKIQIILRRGSGGLNLTIKTVPEIEEFFRTTAGSEGATTPIAAAGRHWYPIGRDTPLLAYTLARTFDPIKMDNGGAVIGVGFTGLGRPLLEAYDGGDGGIIRTSGMTLNMSFLRLVGISEGLGVSFGVKGVFTTENVLNLRNLIGEANKAFYSTYLKRIGLVVTTSVQQL